jgi:hypothetical protein
VKASIVMHIIPRLHEPWLSISRGVDAELLSFENDNCCGILNTGKERGKPSPLCTVTRARDLGEILPKPLAQYPRRHRQDLRGNAGCTKAQQMRSCVEHIIHSVTKLYPTLPPTLEE